MLIYLFSKMRLLLNSKYYYTLYTLFILSVQMSAYYFEEGNIQLDAKQVARDPTIFQVTYLTQLNSHLRHRN